MNTYLKILISAISLIVISGCTAYVDPNGVAPAPTTTTTTRTTTDVPFAGASVTTEETTTSY